MDTVTFTPRSGKHGYDEHGWAAHEACPSCGRHEVMVVCAMCQSWHYGIAPRAHDCDENQDAECMRCGWESGH